jgi:uncharacterized 2Fe-2S/4Fe-4S cluster protein (DUF4445 family)
VGLEITELKEIMLAGGFGNYIRRSHAKRIGLIPDIPDGQIKYIGNTSITGAEIVLLNSRIIPEMENIVPEVTNIEVSLDPEFQMEFASAMIFPS